MTVRQKIQEWAAYQSMHEFAWGRFDCLRFAVEYYIKYKDCGHFKDLLPEYGSEIEAKKVYIVNGRSYIKELDDGLTRGGMAVTEQKRPENMVMIHGPSGFSLGLRMNDTHIILREKRGITVCPDSVLDIKEEWRLKPCQQ